MRTDLEVPTEVPPSYDEIKTTLENVTKFLRHRKKLYVRGLYDYEDIASEAVAATVMSGKPLKQAFQKSLWVFIDRLRAATKLCKVGPKENQVSKLPKIVSMTSIDLNTPEHFLPFVDTYGAAVKTHSENRKDLAEAIEAITAQDKVKYALLAVMLHGHYYRTVAKHLNVSHSKVHGWVQTFTPKLKEKMER